MGTPVQGVTKFGLSLIEVLQKKCLSAESQEKANKQIVSLYRFINTNSPLITLRSIELQCFGLVCVCV